jgi:lipopolysaccharide transport system permease protein
VAIFSQLLLFTSPIFYPIEIVPQPFRTVLELNPVTAIVEEFRQILLWNQQVNWINWSIWVALTAGGAYASYLWFMKTKSGFADVL